MGGQQNRGGMGYYGMQAPYQAGFGNSYVGGFGGQMQSPGSSQWGQPYSGSGFAQQIGTGAPVPNVSQSFMQSSLGSKKGDATYDAFSDFNNDGFVNTSDYGSYMQANPGGQASMVESQQVVDNKQDQYQGLMDQRQSLMDQMRQIDQGLGMMRPPSRPSFYPYGSYGGYKDGGLIKGYQDGGEMMDPRLEEVSMMEEETIQTPSGTDTEVLQIVLEAKAALEGRHPNPEDAVERFVEVFGEEELMSLKEHVLRSIETGVDEYASDGMSDSIPGNIDGVEQVALSEGEYVVPADVVSGIGNGDTGSGARQMREMIENVRMARNGSPEQPPSVDPRMMMPV